jgi:hypothetical protein
MLGGIQFFNRTALVIERLEPNVQLSLLLLKLCYFLLEFGDFLVDLIHFSSHSFCFLDFFVA